MAASEGELCGITSPLNSIPFPTLHPAQAVSPNGLEFHIQELRTLRLKDQKLKRTTLSRSAQNPTEVFSVGLLPDFRTVTSEILWPWSDRPHHSSLAADQNRLAWEGEFGSQNTLCPQLL